MTTFQILASIAALIIGLIICWFVFRPKGQVTDEEMIEADEAKKLANINVERPS